MIISLELPELCPVCDDDTIYVSFKRSKETEVKKTEEKEKEIVTIVWEETIRYNCGCVLTYSKKDGLEVSTACPNAHQIAVILRDKIGKG